MVEVNSGEKVVVDDEDIIKFARSLLKMWTGTDMFENFTTLLNYQHNLNLQFSNFIIYRARKVDTDIIYFSIYKVYIKVHV